MLNYKAYTLQEATRKLEYYCAYQERCHKEVTKKLREMRMIPQSIDHIINHLIQEDYLNEERFAKSYTRGKFNIKNWGRVRILNELKQRDISRYNIKIALKEINDAQYLEKLAALAKKKSEQLNESNKNLKKKKLANYLLYRGWESHLVYDQIRLLIT